jgi:hypothetical protein
LAGFHCGCRDAGPEAHWHRHCSIAYSEVERTGPLSLARTYWSRSSAV